MVRKAYLKKVTLERELTELAMQSQAGAGRGRKGQGTVMGTEHNSCKAAQTGNNLLLSKNRKQIHGT